MALLSGDTDVFVCLLSWRDLGLRELWLICNSGMRRVILPLHDICSALGNNLIKCLPAVHALTGCDTTSKIATKSAALNAVQKLESLLSTTNRKPESSRDILGQMSPINYRTGDV